MSLSKITLYGISFIKSIVHLAEKIEIQIVSKKYIIGMFVAWNVIQRFREMIIVIFKIFDKILLNFFAKIVIEITVTVIN